MKTNNNKGLYQVVGFMCAFLVVICCNAFYKCNIVDIMYVAILCVYIGKYLYLKKCKEID